MSDIVTQLFNSDAASTLTNEAARKIITLEVEIERLRETLREIVKMEPKRTAESQYMVGWNDARYRVLLVAREALGE